MISAATLAGAAGAGLVASFLARNFAGHWWLAGLVATAAGTWAVRLAEPLESLGFLALAAAWGAATAIDLAEHRLPDALTLIPVPLFFLLQMPWAIVEGGWHTMGLSVLSSLTVAAILFVLAYINPDGFGLGDVKLGLTTGAALGWWGVGTALIGLAAAFVLMAVISGVLLAAKRIKRDADIAFGPFMVAGVLVAPYAAGLLGW